MLNKIHTEMDDFSHNIKTIESHEELLGYMSSDIYSSIKLLVYASKTFTMYGRIILFFIIVSTGLLLLAIAAGVYGQNALNVNYIFVAFSGLVFLTLAYIIHCKKYLIASINKSKIFREQAEEQTQDTNE